LPHTAWPFLGRRIDPQSAHGPVYRVGYGCARAMREIADSLTGATDALAPNVRGFDVMAVPCSGLYR